ncbi:MAG: hypothetical protein KY467_03705 [Gemmatimonadetes bacterium]|nr:hypothetical protein [Gemmatimonadota bacterium]
MGTRALAAVALFSLAACSAPAPRTLTAGDALPAEWKPADVDSGVALLWVFRTRDCLSCEEVDEHLRRVQREFGASVAIVAVHVGNARDATVPRSFFASRRVALARQVRHTPREFRRTFGDVTLPAVLVASGSRIVWSSAGPASSALTPHRLDGVLRRHVGGSESVAPEHAAGNKSQR